MAVSKPKIKTLSAVTVSTNGTAVPLSSSPQMVYSATIISLGSNTGTQYLGDSTVTSVNGAPLEPNGDYELMPPPNCGTDQFDLSEVYVNSSTDNAAFRIVAWIRS